MDFHYFRDYERRQLEKEAMDNTEQVFNEKFSKLERMIVALKQVVTAQPNSFRRNETDTSRTQTQVVQKDYSEEMELQHKKLVERIDNEHNIIE